MRSLTKFHRKLQRLPDPPMQELQEFQHWMAAFQQKVVSVMNPGSLQEEKAFREDAEILEETVVKMSTGALVAVK